MINGKIGIDLNDDPFINLQLATGTASGPGIYFTVGSGGVEGASEAGYYRGRYWMPMPMPGPV